MAIRKTRYELYREAVRGIAASKSVHEFYIGFTSRPTHKYFWYKANGFKHMVVIADRLTENDAKDVEKYLQEECRKSDKRTALGRKASKYMLARSYRRGAGGPNPAEDIHSVYLAWK